MEDRTKADLPTVVKVLGWGWLVLGCLMILSGMMGLAAWTFMNRMSPGGFPPPNANFPPQFAPMLALFEHFSLLAVCQIVFALGIVATAANFLKLREWARIGLLIVSVLAAAYVIGFTIFWIYTWVGITSAAPAGPQGVSPPLAFSIFGIVGAVVNMILFSTPPILSIVALCGKTVREAIDRTSAGQR